jgi:hypothetical protein
MAEHKGMRAEKAEEPKEAEAKRPDRRPESERPDRRREPRPEPKEIEPVTVEPVKPLVLEQATIPVPVQKRKPWFDQIIDKLFGAPKPKFYLPENGLREAGFTFFTVKANGTEIKYLRCPCGKNHLIKE